jgi:FG-GAP repeat
MMYEHGTTILRGLAALALATPMAILAAKGGDTAAKSAPAAQVLQEGDLRTNSPGSAADSPIAEVLQSDSVVAVSGDTAAVTVTRGRRVMGLFTGPMNKEVYVYKRTSGAWAVQAVLLASDPAEGTAYGSSIALLGDTLVVGVGNPTPPASMTGGTPVNPTSVKGAYVYQRVGTSWIERARLVGSDALTTSYQYGSRVAVSGSTIVVGASGGDRISCSPTSGACRTLERRAGRLYVFDRDALGTWRQTASMTVQSPHGALFAFDGNTIVAPEFETVVNGGMYTGTLIGHAAVYQRSAGLWKRQATLSSKDQTTLAQFADVANVPSEIHGLFVGGMSFGGPALHGDTLLVPGGDFNVLGGGGGIKSALYVFQRSAGVWTQPTRITAAGRTSNDGFGRSIALSGRAALVNYNAGMAKVSLFARSADGTWNESVIKSPGKLGGGTFDFFGENVALDGTTALVTQPQPRALVYRLTLTP